jgi:hypothetical protein
MNCEYTPTLSAQGKATSSSHNGHSKLKMLSDFVSAGYDEAEVRTASRETNVPVYRLDATTENECRI